MGVERNLAVELVSCWRSGEGRLALNRGYWLGHSLCLEKHVIAIFRIRGDHPTDAVILKKSRYIRDIGQPWLFKDED